MCANMINRCRNKFRRAATWLALRGLLGKRRREEQLALRAKRRAPRPPGWVQKGEDLWAFVKGGADTCIIYAGGDFTLDKEPEPLPIIFEVEEN